MWATAPRYSGRYSRERMASPRPPGPLAYAERVQRGVPIEVQPLDAEHPHYRDEGRHLEHESELDDLRAVHGASRHDCRRSLYGRETVDSASGPASRR